ncbi:DUF1206 domain-containing protein [Proteobacteria bacterium 005FR1]|nr:DUF1206 domain-containing protein [Proteobacteria bacterium 005FR1]
MTDVALQRSFKHWAQLGYAARGVVYLVIGGLALLAAFGEGGSTTDARGAILKIFSQPFGQVLLWAMVVGLLGYVVWRFIQSVQDVDHHGHSAKGIAIRTGLMVSAITHLALAVWTFQLLIGSGGGGSSGKGQAQTLLGSEWGQVVFAVVGIAVIIAGFAHIFKGWSARFERYMHIPANQRNWARPVCQFGLIARGVVWLIIGWFFLDSVFTAQQGEVSGIAEALGALRNSSYGPWLLAVVAAGLFAFGVYSLLEALYRRIDAPG